MASRENRALSSGDDASNIPNARDWTQQAPESSNITFLGVTEGDQPLDTDPTQQPLFVESAEEIVQDFVKQNEPGGFGYSEDMPYSVRVRERIVEYTYTEEDAAIGAIVDQDDVGEIQQVEGTEPPNSGYGGSFQFVHAGQAFGGLQPQHTTRNEPPGPTNFGLPPQGFGPCAEPYGFGDVGDPSDEFVPPQRSRGQVNPSFNNGPRITNFIAQPTIYAGPTQINNNINISIHTDNFADAAGRSPPMPRYVNTGARARYPLPRDPRLQHLRDDGHGPSFSQGQGLPHQARFGWTENRADLASVVPGVDDGLPTYPRPQAPRFGQRPVVDPRQATERSTNFGTIPRAGPRTGFGLSMTHNAPESDRSGIDNTVNVRQQGRRPLSYVQNFDNPSAQMIPVDASGNPTRPSTARLPSRPGPLGLGTLRPRLKREDIQADDVADDDPEESGLSQPRPGRRRRHEQAFTRVGDSDGSESDDKGAELQRGKRSRRLSAAEGEGDKKKYEKRPGVVRLEGPTENLQVLDPDSKHWRDAVYHHTIRRIFFQNAGPTSQYRVQRASGTHRDDQTSFLAVQRNWGLDRPDGWVRIIDRILYRFECNGYEPPVGLRAEPGYMMHNDRVVIDRENHPIRDWPLIPAILSTQFEGGYMEAIRRLCAGIRLYDFWARMPVEDNDRVRIGVTGLGNRTERFRNNNGLAPWRLRSGGTELRDAIRAKMSQADRDANSTRNVIRLTEAELAAAKARNKESAASMAKSRTHQERIARQKKAKETRETQSQEQEEQYQAEEHNAESSFISEDRDQPADAQDEDDDQEEDDE